MGFKPYMVAGKSQSQHLLEDVEGLEAVANPKPAVCASMNAAKVEFLAEKELVTIIQNLCLDKTYFMGAERWDLGPFNPGLPVEMPLWLAINLKQRSVGCFLWSGWMWKS